MRTFLLTTQGNLEKHSGEEYHDFMTVEAIMEPDKMPAIANEIRNKLRGLIVEAQKEGNNQEKHIKVEVDTTPPYHVIMVSLADLMGKDEGLEIELPEFLTGRRNEAENNATINTVLKEAEDAERS